jgi:hypothetical protein
MSRTLKFRSFWSLWVIDVEELCFLYVYLYEVG